MSRVQLPPRVVFIVFIVFIVAFCSMLLGVNVQSNRVQNTLFVFLSDLPVAGIYVDCVSFFSK